MYLVPGTNTNVTTTPQSGATIIAGQDNTGVPRPVLTDTSGDVFVWEASQIDPNNDRIRALPGLNQIVDVSGNAYTYGTIASGFAASGYTNIVTGQSGQKVYVLGYATQLGSGLSVQQWQLLAGSGGTAITPAWQYASGNLIGHNRTPNGFCALGTTVASGALTLSLAFSGVVLTEIQYLQGF